MTPTVFVALLTHQRVTPATGGPLHLSLHTTEAGASTAVMAALTAEWDRSLAYSLGPSSEWAEDRLLAEAERQGYTAEVTETPVELSE